MAAVIELYVGNDRRVESPPLLAADGTPVRGVVRVAIHATDDLASAPLSTTLRLAASPVSEQPAVFEATFRGESLRAVPLQGARMRLYYLVWVGPGVRVVQRVRVHAVRSG